MNKLNDIFDINERMKALKKQLEFLESQAYNALSDIKENTKNEFDTICADRLKLYNMIANVKDSVLRTLLEYRYVYLMNYDDIAELTNYSLRQVMRKISEGIKEVEKVS